MNGNALYPRYFKTPEGKAISISTLQNALRTIREDPDASYPGWNWYETTGHLIIGSVMAGINDRINRRGH